MSRQPVAHPDILGLSVATGKLGPQALYPGIHRVDGKGQLEERWMGARWWAGGPSPHEVPSLVLHLAIPPHLAT